MRKMGKFFPPILKSRRLIVILLITGISAFFYAKYVLGNQLERIESSMSQLEMYSEALESSILLREKIGKLEAEIAGYKAMVERLQERFPSSPDLPALTLILFRLAQEHGLEGSNLHFSGPFAADGYSFFTVSFSVKGERENVYCFLQEIEKQPLKLSFEKLHISPAEGAMLDAQVVLNSYLIPWPVEKTSLQEYKFLPEEYGYEYPFEMFKATTLSQTQSQGQKEELFLFNNDDKEGPETVNGDLLYVTAPEEAVVSKEPAVRLFYTVQAGDTLESIAALFGVDPADIVSRNDLKDGLLYVGQQLVIR